LRARAADQLPLNGPLSGPPIIDVYEVDEL